MKTTTFETAKVGDEVWSMMHGWGSICAIETEDNFPVKVIFDELEESYLYSGACFNNCSQTLFWDEVVIEAPAKPMPVLQVDAKILVWDVPEEKHKRHFSHFDEYGYIYTFTDGKTSFTSRGTEVSKWLDWDFAE